MLGKRKLNQIVNDDWNNSYDPESEIVTVPKKKLLKDWGSKILMNSK